MTTPLTDAVASRYRGITPSWNEASAYLAHARQLERTAAELRTLLADLASVAQEYIDALRDLAVKERTSCGQRLYDARECEADAECGLVKAIAVAGAAGKGGHMTTSSNGGGTATMNFVQFAGTHNPAPKNMAVGEIIISIAQDGGMYTIRRDK